LQRLPDMTTEIHQTAVQFLLVEPDPECTRQICDGLRELKISNPVVVFQDPTDAASFLRSTSASGAVADTMLLLGAGLSARQKEALVVAVRQLPCKPLEVASVRSEPWEGDLRVRPLLTTADHAEVSLAYVSQVLQGVALVVTTT
jgi:hypothetical protein